MGLFLCGSIKLHFLLQEEISVGSTVLLQNVENYAMYVGAAIVNDNIDTGNRTTIVLPRTNISKP